MIYLFSFGAALVFFSVPIPETKRRHPAPESPDQKHEPLCQTFVDVNGPSHLWVMAMWTALPNQLPLVQAHKQQMFCSSRLVTARLEI